MNLYFQNKTSGEEQILVTGGYYDNEATGTQIYRGFFYNNLTENFIFF